MTNIKRFLTLFLIAAVSISAWGANYSETIGKSALASMLSGSYTDATSYWKVPASSGNSATITIPASYFTNQPTSNVTLTFSIATFSSGTDPSSSNTTITAVGSETSSTWSGSSVSTYPSSSTYVNGVMTLTKAASPTTLGGLTITMGVNTGVKIFRLQSIKIEYTYSDAPYTVTLSKNGSTTDITGRTGTYTLPTTGEHVADACTGWSWHCWTNAPYAPSTPSTTAPSTTKITTMTAAGTAYAVYKHTEASGGGSSTSTFVSADQGWDNGDVATTKEISGATYSFAQNGGSNAPKFYTSSNGVHLYPKNQFTVNAGSGTISSIVFTLSRNDGWSANIGTWTSGTSTWTGSASSVTFTVPNTSGYQVRITSAVVTIGGGTTTTYTSSPTCGAVYDLLFYESDGATDNGEGKVTANATSFSFSTAPTAPTGKELEGFYAENTLTTKIANANRTFIANVTGWTDADGKYTKGDDAFLFLKWQDKHYTITYDPGANGTGSIAAGNKTHGVNFTLSSSTFSRAGYTQTGWSTTDGGGKAYNLGGTYSENADITLYPYWEQNIYTIAWDANGTDWSGAGHGNPTTSGVTHGSTIAIFPTSPTNAACDGTKEFVGWCATEIGSETDVKPTFVSPKTPITGNMTLHAVFANRTADSYTLGDVHDLISGKQVIIYNANRGKAMSSSGDGVGRLTGTDVSLSGSVISSPVGSVVWTVQLNGSKYQFKHSTEYLYASGSGQTKLFCGATVDNWTISDGSASGKYKLKSDASSPEELEAFYSTTNGYFFTTYTAGSNSDYDHQFYVPTYTKYITSCTKCATPTFTPAAGAYDATINVTITSTAGATIYYTTDGSTPNTSSSVYSSPIAVSANTTIKAYATKAGLDDSSVGEASYTFQVMTPTFSVPGGEYSNVQSIYLNCTTVGATIYYTTNGTNPTTGSTRYTGSPIVLDAAGTTTIKAIAIKDGLPNSEIASATYTITKPTGTYVASFVTGDGNPSIPDKWTVEEDSKQYLYIPNGPTPACSTDGWEFAGWAEASQSETTVAPRLYMPGDSKQLTSNETLYAVYRKETGGTSTSTYNASSMTSGYTEIAEDYWWLQNATGVEFYINSYYLASNLFQIYYYEWSGNPYHGWALVDAHRRIKDISFTNSSSYPIYDVGTDDGSATLTTTDATHQTVTCDGNVTQVFLYPQDQTNSSYKIKLSQFTVTYYNAKFNSNPVCDPIRPAEPERLTSYNGERVYTTDITVSGNGLTGSTLTATITGTNAAMFGYEIADAAIVDGNISTTYRVWYQPTAPAANHTATLTFKDSKSPTPNSAAVTLYGRSVPAEFAIVAYDGATYYALDGSMTGAAGHPVALPVTVNGSNQVENCPTRAVYSLTDTDPQGQYVHLQGTAGLLWGGSSTTINTNPSATTNTSWLLATEDFSTYHITNMEVATRGIMMYNGVFGHYATGNYGKSGYYGDLRILPIATKCTSLDAPTPTVIAKSNRATLTWEAIEGADHYEVTCTGAGTPVVGSVTGSGPFTCEITGLSNNTTYNYTIKSVAASNDCSVARNGTFTTTNCDDVPSLGEVTVTATTATVNWTCGAATATVKVYSNAACTEDEVIHADKTSPYTINSLTSGTTYYYKVFAGGSCPSAVGSFTTEELTLDVAEWRTDAVVIHYNGDANLTLTTFNEVSHGDKSAQAATELFISKYFEAQSNVKMIGLFNGTNEDIDLSNYEIKVAQHGTKGYGSAITWESVDINKGRTAAQKILPPMTEIIFYSSFDANAKDDNILDCAKSNPETSGWDRYVSLGARMTFNGDDPVGLFKNGTLIDVIGGGTTSAGSCLEADIVTSSTDNKNGFMDSPGGWYTTTGIDYDNQAAGQTYALSTNRCLLIRLNTVTSGATAVSKNTSTFLTLGGEFNEWMGKQIPTPLDGSGDPDKNDVTSSCNAFEALGTYNYAQYYTSFETFGTPHTFEDYKSDPFDGTYIIPVAQLDTMACTQVRIELKDGSDNLVVRKDIKVPIMVTGTTKTTSDAIFHNYDKDAEVCKTCDVVIFSNAILTKEDNSDLNDVPEVRDVKIYQGGKLVVPSGTSYTVNSLAFRRQEDVISMADIQGTLTAKKANGVSLDVRIDPSNWHFVSLPYNCNVSDICFSDGRPAVAGEDYLLRWYDGGIRAANQSGGWQPITSGVLRKGQGFIVALPGTGIIKEELRFPMANDVITDEQADKTITPVYGYGNDKTDEQLPPNNKGWNLIGNPYMMYYASDLDNPLAVGHLDVVNYVYQRTGSLKYLVTPNGWNGRNGYSQVPIDTHMKPFTAYFVQIGGANPSIAQDIDFHQDHAGMSSIMARYWAEEEKEDTHPIWFGVTLTAPNEEKDNTTLLLSNDFTDNYDMMDDLVKMRSPYYNRPKINTAPILASRNNAGEMAFNALPDSSAAAGVPLNYYVASDGLYTFAIDQKYSTEEVESAILRDLTNNKDYDLLMETPSFALKQGDNTTRFILFVRVERKKPQSPTDLDTIERTDDGGVRKILINNHVYILRDGTIYDVTGKRVSNR